MSFNKHYGHNTKTIIRRSVQAAQDRIWITKDGQKIPYTEMDNSHLMNSIAMILRVNVESLVKARDPIHTQQRVLEGIRVAEMLSPHLLGLIRESYRRGITDGQRRAHKARRDSRRKSTKRDVQGGRADKHGGGISNHLRSLHNRR